MATRARANQAYADHNRSDPQTEARILEYLPLVRHVVNKVVGNIGYRGDIEDLVSAGTLGLVKAARAFDPNRHAEFKTYAYIRIRGSVFDELRARSFVPSTVHGMIKRIEQAYNQFSATRGRPPADEELAETLNMPLEQMYRTLEEGRKQSFLSIHGLTDDQPAIGGFIPPDQQAGPEEVAIRNELCERLVEAITHLSERDQALIVLYYDRDLTMKEAAEVLGISEARVSQLHASALFKLSMKLGATP